VRSNQEAEGESKEAWDRWWLRAIPVLSIAAAVMGLSSGRCAANAVAHALSSARDLTT